MLSQFPEKVKLHVKHAEEKIFAVNSHIYHLPLMFFSVYIIACLYISVNSLYF